MFSRLAVGLIVLFSFVKLVGADQGNITFLPHWVNQAQFAGYFVAAERGFYDKQGLRVKLLTGGPDAPPSNMLENGSADIASTFLTAAIKKRAQGVPIVNVAQVVQRSALMLVAKKSLGVGSPADLSGKKIGVWGAEFQLQPKALLRRFGVQAQLVPQSVSVNLFLKGGVDVASAAWYNEYHTILSSGINPDELTTIFYDQYGLNFPEDGLYCLKDYFEKNREKVCGFVRASLDGWIWALENKEDSIKIVMKYVNAGRFASNMVHQRWMLSRMQDLVWPDGNRDSFGKLNQDDYRRVATEMVTQGEIVTSPEYNDFSRGCEGYVKE